MVRLNPELGFVDPYIQSLISRHSTPQRPFGVHGHLADDTELGFVDTAMKVAGGVVKGLKKVGKIFKTKKAKKKAKAKAASVAAAKKKATKAKPKGKVIQMDMQEIVGEVPKSAVSAAKDIIQAAASSSNSSADMVRQIVAAVPGPVRDVVLEALKAQTQNAVVKEQTMNNLAGQIDEALKPQIVAMLSALQAQQLSKQATYEHENLVSEAKFKDGTIAGLQQVLDRLSNIEARLNGSAIVPPKRVSIYGSRNILEG